MFQALIPLLMDSLVIAILGYVMYLICTKFFEGFKPALWICGVILLILAISLFSGGVNVPWHYRSN